MHVAFTNKSRHAVAILAGAFLFMACAESTPMQPTTQPASRAELTGNTAQESGSTIATLRRVTARYHDLDVAKADGFVLLHDCESIEGEGTVGIVYVHINRLLDGVINPELPDALIYEPAKEGRPRLVGVEFAVPFSLWQQPTAPEFLGNRFQSENDVGAYALHAWMWRNNPKGMFAETNPNVSCQL